MRISRNKKSSLKSSKKAFLVRAVISALPVVCNINTVNGWCWTASSNHHRHHRHHLKHDNNIKNNDMQYQYHQSCSLRPTFAPRSQRTILWERPPYRQRKSPYDDDFMSGNEFSENDDPNVDPPQGRRPRERRPRADFDNYYDDDDDYDDPYAADEENKDSFMYGEEEDYYEEEDYVIPSPKVEWEELEVLNPRAIPDDDDTYSKVYVLLPPSPPTMHPLPSAVLHFVGGTLFGSAPKVWYRTLLEDIVTHTQCAIIVTPLPVITPLNSQQFSGPLQHVSMARRLQYQFQYAYEAVLEDEYGRDAMKSVPIAGLGHSLGSRLLVVLATLMAKEASRKSQQQQQEIEEDSRRRKRRPGFEASYQYKSMILISFTNYGASAGIPGLSSLLKQRAQLDQKKQKNPDSSNTDRQRQRQKKTRSQRSRYDYDYDDDEYDDDDDDDEGELLEELSELWVGMKGAFEDQTRRVKTVLTPQAKDLEFHPSPRKLWQTLEGSTDSYRVPQTLLIQFDQDDIDQSSKLATVLVSNKREQVSNEDLDSDTSNGATAATATASPPISMATTDLKFARLRGTHLTPISTGNSKEDDLDQFRRKNRGLLQEWSSRTTKALWKVIQGRVTGGSVYGMSQEEALLDLRQSITRYIADIVTK